MFLYIKIQKVCNNLVITNKKGLIKYNVAGYQAWAAAVILKHFYYNFYDFNKYVIIVTSTRADPQANRMHTAKKTLSGRGGNEGNTNELITVTCKTKQDKR